LVMFCICFFLLVCSVTLWCISAFSQNAAEWISIHISGALRFFLAFLTSPFPGSVAEVFLPSVVLCFFLFFTAHLTRLVRFGKQAIPPFIKFWVKIACVSAILLSFFITGYLICYKRNSLEQNLALKSRKISVEELVFGMETLQSKLNQIADKVTFSKNAGSVMPYSYEKLNRLINESYDGLSKKYPFLSDFHSNVKLLGISPLMTYTHLSGMYIPMTGEANLNTNYPDYIIVYTEAHEMAHQRGIAPEDEANFMAYLVCMNSDDLYLNYCGLMSMYDYFGDALYSADKDRYYVEIEKSDQRILGEIKSFSDFFKKYSHSKASEITDSVNDNYLKSQGQSSGVESYGMVVDLAVAYLEQEQKNQANK